MEGKEERQKGAIGQGMRLPYPAEEKTWGQSRLKRVASSCIGEKERKINKES